MATAQASRPVAEVALDWKDTTVPSLCSPEDQAANGYGVPSNGAGYLQSYAPPAVRSLPPPMKMLRIEAQLFTGAATVSSR